MPYITLTLFRDNTLHSRQLRKILSMQKSQAIFPLVHERILKCNKCGESATVGSLDSCVKSDTLGLTHRKHVSVSVMITATINIAVCPSKHEANYCPALTF